MRARRALLYVPGDDLHKIQKAATLRADSVCLDMEDGVAASRKRDARSTIAQVLQSLDFGRSERLARTNPIGSGLGEEDLLAVLPARPDGIVIPKVEDGEQVRRAGRIIAEAEERSGWEPGTISLIAVVESAAGILNLRQIASADPRLDALIFGAEDYAENVGAVRTPGNLEVLYARSALVAHAAAFGLQAIDLVYVDFRDPAGLEREAIEGAQLGFSGKQVIHPDQIAPVQEAFSPSPQAIQQALEIIQADESHQEAGIGAFALNGRMVDAPIVKAAERLLARARAAGNI